MSQPADETAAQLIVAGRSTEAVAIRAVGKSFLFARTAAPTLPADTIVEFEVEGPKQSSWRITGVVVHLTRPRTGLAGYAIRVHGKPERVERSSPPVDASDLTGSWLVDPSRRPSWARSEAPTNPPAARSTTPTNPPATRSTTPTPVDAE